MQAQPHMTVRTVPMLDTGLGREAGYANDAELIEAAKEQRRTLTSIIAPDVLARLDAAEAEIERRVLIGA